ncbi:molecular chaperone DnaJ [Acinetobacter sp. V91_7]|uniref:J domain-containing protein n=1 Tax=unclassified Acinetobacter TaxID=196816 RepID=UPI00287CD90D|nr:MULTISPECIES: molecular chaperone DnaJ [unclassified Acinetobacter]MDS7932877.1 molecular chaperone DnaJ [Acinetobacter sp. V91_4B]MDS7961864.1 molecular chaperone DnaJ [Acinetobacter sp. V91_7]MDS8028937.1 molecular chaperone DnaJ [Acinetobacter sp. V91_13]
MLRASDNIYFAPAIPYKKLQGAMSYLSQGIHPDEILMLIDDTVFGSAKAGLCITATGLFYKESFGDDAAYHFKNINHVEADIGVINHGIVLNRMETLTFTQLDKGTVRTLASFLNEVCQGQTETDRAPPQIDAELKVIIDLFAYFITFNMGRWNAESSHAISNHFAKLNNEASPHYIKSLLTEHPNFEYEDLLHRFAELKDVLAYKLRTEMIEQLVYAMALGQVEQTQADLFMTHLCRVSNVSKAVFPDLVKIIYQCLADEKQANAPALNSEQQHACKLLDIQPQLLTEQVLQSAYRKKMAEFHPDKYQSLPESVRQLIESQAQQLNEAWTLLKSYLGNN